MERELVEVKLPDSGLSVYIAPFLTFGETKRLRGVFQKNSKGELVGGTVQTTFSGEVATMFEEMKYKVFIKRIVKNGTDVPFTEDNLMDFLGDFISEKDGEVIDAEIDGRISFAKKKST